MFGDAKVVGANKAGVILHALRRKVKAVEHGQPIEPMGDFHLPSIVATGAVAKK